MHIKYLCPGKKLDESPRSNIENFSARSGTFSKKDIIYIGIVSGLTVEVIKLTDLTTNIVISGIKLSAYNIGGYSSSAKTAFLDADEIDGLLKAIGYINEKVFPSDIPANSVEYNYTSRSGFTADGFSSSKKWKGHLLLEKYDSGSSFFYSVEDFKKIGDLIIQAQAKLKSL